MEPVTSLLRKHESFFKYAFVGGAISLLNIFLLWLLIDIVEIPTIISSTIVVGGTFFLKFFLYRWTGYSK